MAQIKVIQAEFKEKFITLDGITIIPHDNTILTNTIEKILSKIKGGLIVLCDKEWNTLVLSSLLGLSFDKTAHPIVLFTDPVYDASYFNTYIVTTYPIAANSKLLHFTETYERYFHYSSKDITTKHIHTFAALEYLHYVIHSTKSININDILENIRGKQVDTSVGVISLQNNNYFTGVFYTMLFQLNPIIKTYMFEPYKTNPYTFATDEYYFTCDWVEGYEKKETEAFPLGVILSFSDDNKIQNRAILDMVFTLVGYLNDNGGFSDGINNYPIKYYIYDYNGNLLLAQAYAKALIDNPYCTVVIGCADSKCRRAISPSFDGVNTALLYVGLNEGQECNRNIVRPGRVYNQYRNIIEKLPELFESDIIYVIGLNLVDTHYFYEIVKNILSEVTTSEVIEVSVELADTNLYTLLYDIHFSTKKYIVIDLFEGSDFLTFSNYVNDINIPSTKAIFVSLYCPGIDYENQYASFEGRYCISSYYTPNNVMSKLSYLALKYASRSYINEVMDNIFIVLSLFDKTLTEHFSFNVYEILTSAYHSEITSTNGDIKFFPNGYFSRTMFLLKLENQIYQPFIYQEVAAEPMAYNWYIEDTFGFICDYSNSNILDKKEVELFVIGIAIAVTGSYATSDSGISDLLRVSIEKANQDGLIDNKRLYFKVIDIGEDDSTCYESISKSLSGISLLFTTASMTCQYMIVDDLEKDNILLFSLDQSYSDKCSKNIIQFGRHASQTNDILDRFLFYGKDFALIGVNRDYGDMYSDYFSTYIPKYGGNLMFSVLLTPTNTDYDKIFENLFNRMSAGIILFFGLPEHLITVVNILESQDRMKDFFVVSLTVSEEVTEMNNHVFYAISSYWNSSPKESVKQLIKNIKGIIGYERILSEKMVLTYMAFQYWYKAASSEKSLDNNIIRDYMYDNVYEGILGNVQLLPNNMITLPILFIQFDNNKPTLLYKSLNSKIPIQYNFRKSNEYYQCNIIEGYTKLKGTDVRIALLTSVTGFWKIMEESYYTSFLYVVDKINEEGGILDSFIIIEIIDAASSIEGYENAIDRVVLRDDIQATFFYGVYDVKKVVTAKAEQYKKLVIHSGYTVAETCPQYTITVGPLNNQLFKLFTVLSAKTKNVVIVYDDKPTNLDLVNITVEYTINYMMNVYLININDGNATDQLMKLQDLRPFTILALEGQNLIKFLMMINNEKFPKSFYTFVLFGVNDYFIQEYAAETNRMYVFNSFFNTLLSDQTYIKENHFFDELYQKHKNGDRKYFITADSESAYTSLMLWKKAILNVYSFDSESVRKGMYGIQLETIGSTVLVLTNNYISHRVYAAMAINGNLMIVVAPNNPSPPVVYNPYNYGFESYTCDWEGSSGIYGEKVYRNTRKIGFIFSLEEIVRKEAMQTLSYATVYIDEINLKGGVLNSILIPRIMCYRNEEALKENMKNLMEDNEVSVIFGCQVEECRDEYMKYPKNKMLYYFGSSTNNFCYDTVVNVLPPILQRIPPIINYLNSISVTSYYVFNFGSDEYLFIFYI